MHVLHILDHSIPLHSGYTFRTRNILREQQKLGWQTSHLTGLKQYAAGIPLDDASKNLRDSGYPSEETVDGLHFYRTPQGNSLVAKTPVVNQWQVVTTLSRRILEVAKRVKPDILHAHSPALNGLAALRAGEQLGIPVVYECRAFWEDAAVDHGTSKEWGIRYRITRALESSVFRRANAVTTICEGLRQEIVTRGIRADKITVIPNAVDIENFEFASSIDQDLQDSLGLTGKTVLGFIGSFYAYEGLPLLLEVMPELKKSNPDIRLLLIGGGPQESIIKKQVKKLGLQNEVILTGRVPHGQVQGYYNLVDVLVYPRLSMRLTDLVTPLKPLESMAQGRILLASDVGGHRELIKDGETGYLFKAGSVDDLTETVLRMLDHKSDWQQIRLNGREFVERERNWQVSVANYASIYRQLAGNCHVDG